MIELTKELVAGWLPRRPGDAHKGRFGTLSAVVGSARYRGAAQLAAHAALRCGAGIVRVCSVEPVCAAVAVALPCCTLLPLPAGEGGGIAGAGAAALLAEPATALLAGCGLGNTADTAKLVEALLRGDTAPKAGSAPSPAGTAALLAGTILPQAATAVPLVLDADALNVLAGHLAGGGDAALRARLLVLLATCPRPVVLTPHPGEAARLAGLTTEEVLDNRYTVAAALAEQYRCVVVLKSEQTVVALPDGTLYTCPLPGNAGLAKGGSGDVLAGAIASLLAQGLPAGQAAAAGVWLHAVAGQRAAEQWGRTGLTPAELPPMLALLLKELEQEQE